MVVMVGLLLAALVTSIATPLASQKPTAEFLLEPRSISAGDSARLSWEVQGAVEVFVSGIGLVSRVGQQMVHPDQRTEYILVAEGTGGVETVQSTLSVSGVRGDGDYPDFGDFKYPLSFKIESPSFVALVDRVHGVLQNTMEFSVASTRTAQGDVRLITVRREQAELVAPNEPRIGRRRVAYAVELAVPRNDDDAYSYSIQTLIEYRRRIERTWRPERSDSLFFFSARRLANQLQESH